MEQAFRLDLNKSWEAIDIKTGHAVLIPKGSHQAIRILVKSPPDQTEENYLVVAVQGEGGPVLAGLREAYWRQSQGLSHRGVLPTMSASDREVISNVFGPRSRRFPPLVHFARRETSCHYPGADLCCRQFRPKTSNHVGLVS